MIPRYADARIDAIFSDKAKVKRWQEVELAVIEARVNLGLVDRSAHLAIKTALETNPCDIDWWLRRDKEISHDLNAFLEERLRYIRLDLQSQWHRDMTSYDTEDAAFAQALLGAAVLVLNDLAVVIAFLREFAPKHRYTVMLERTHGQWAKLRSFGGRVLTWLKLLLVAEKQLGDALLACQQSRISGAIGNYGGGLTPEIEREALRILGLTPFPGATQILPRIVQAPLAQALRLVAEAFGQIAMDFRLGARSGKPLWHEPFGKKQKGSSAMPHKKNTINTEQEGGMLNLVRGAELSILLSIQTWEGRAIEQSCVERVAWPDLFHEVLRMILVMHKVLGGMVVYPDHMLQEIQDSRGTYASDEAKNFLASECVKHGEEFETAYRIIQLASFCVFKPTAHWALIREEICESLDEADQRMGKFSPASDSRVGIREILAYANLFPVAELDATPKQVQRWNDLLESIFSGQREVRERWAALFLPSHLLKGEAFLFDTILGEKG